jgi:hypothetical protein
MVDRHARDHLSQLLSEFASGRLTNFAFEDGVPSSTDPAIAAVASAVWPYYDDLSEHTLTGRFELDSSDHGYFRRMRDFLSTDLQYGWRSSLALELLYLVLGPLSLGLIPRWVERLRRPRWFAEVWPFSHPQELRSALGPLA